MNNISVSDLSFAYPGTDKLILKDINLEISAGEFVCVLGQSGCGKSTFLRLIAGLEKPTTGELKVGDKPITGAGLDRAVVFQDYGLFPWLTAGANITLALKQRYPDMSKADLKTKTLESLESVGLDKGVYSKLPKELSGGMKQRCAIARALGIDSPILLMDEPFGALDAVTRARLQDLVLRLWDAEEQKKTVIFVTHDVDEAMLLSTRTVLFGQSPSHVIFDKTRDVSERPTRKTQFSDPNVLQLRNELIERMNIDINEHADAQ